MARLTTAERDRLVTAAYQALLERVTEGKVAGMDATALVAEQGAEWGRRGLAIYLASALVDYAAGCTVAETGSRERARRRRVYAISQSLYDNLRLMPSGAGDGRDAAVQGAAA